MADNEAKQLSTVVDITFKSSGSEEIVDAFDSYNEYGQEAIKTVDKMNKGLKELEKTSQKSLRSQEDVMKTAEATFTKMNAGITSATGSFGVLTKAYKELNAIREKSKDIDEIRSLESSMARVKKLMDSTITYQNNLISAGKKKSDKMEEESLQKLIQTNKKKIADEKAMLAKREEAYQKLAKTQENAFAKGNKVFTKMKAGIEDSDTALRVLNNTYSRLSELAEKNSGNKRFVDETEKSMAKIKSMIESTYTYQTNLKKAGVNTNEAIEKNSLKKLVAQNREKTEKVKQNIKEEINAYKQLSAVRDAGSKTTLTDFRDSSSGLRQNIVSAGVALSAIRYISSAVRESLNGIVEINYNTINTQRIMGDFSEKTKTMLEENASLVAKNTNIQITDAQNIQASWVRINERYADSAQLLGEITELTSKFMNVGDIENAEDAVKLLNASLLQFNVTTEETITKSEEFLNKWAYMADKTAMGTADEYGQAISKFGANIVNMNGTMDDAIALSSILADKLAKGGDEAGTALKTFTSYLNRGKTRSLFAEIAIDLGDTNYNLADANGQLKDFDDNLRTIAKAYKEYKSTGNDVMAQNVLEAVGATRQRDTALSILNSVNDGSFDSYYDQLGSSEITTYLEDQNEALMQTLSAQINAFKVSVQELVMFIANSGVVDVFTTLLKGVGGLASALTNVNPTLMKFITTIAMFKVMQSVGTYFANTTGIVSKFNSILKHGTKVEIENAQATNMLANAYVTQMNAMQKNGNMSLEALQVFNKQKIALAELERAYNAGEITAIEYDSAVKNLIGTKQLESVKTDDLTQSILGEAQAMEKQIKVVGNQAQAWKASTIAKQEAITTEKSYNLNIAKTIQNSNGRIATFIKERSAHKLSTLALKEKLVADRKSVV